MNHTKAALGILLKRALRDHGNRLAEKIRAIADADLQRNRDTLAAEADRSRGEQSSPPPAAPPPAPSAATTLAVRWSGDFSSSEGLGKVIGREADHDKLTEYARNSETGIVTVTAIGGQGKTALVRSWIEDNKAASSSRDFESCFAFSFEHGHGQDKFAQELVAFLDAGGPARTEGKHRSVDLVDKLGDRKILLLLDGLEAIQIKDRKDETRGHIERGPVLNLLFGLCQEVGKCQSLAVVTSRLHLLGFHDYDNKGVRNLDLPGLSVEAGNRFLMIAGLRSLSDDKRKQYCRDLAGHPKLLGIFADAVQRREDASSFDNAAEVIAEETRIAELEDVQDMLNSFSVYYREILSPLELSVVSAVAAYGESVTREYIISYLRHGGEIPIFGEAPLIGRPLQQLTKAGILTLNVKGGHQEYDLHPSLREGFAPSSDDMRRAAAVVLYGRPAPTMPRSLAEAETYLWAIRILTKAGDFNKANEILRRNLNYGDVLNKLYGGQRELLNCLKTFLGPKRRDECETMRGSSWMIAMIPRLVMAAIDLHEWEEAEQYADWDKTLLEKQSSAPEALSCQLRAQIAAEIGEGKDAEELYRIAIKNAKPEIRSDLILELAELEGDLGAFAPALKRIGDWLSDNHSASAWIQGWDKALLVLQYTLKRARPDIAARCQAARAAVSDTKSIRAPTHDQYVEYEKLNLKPRTARVPEEWERQLDLADALAANAESDGTRAQGSWPFARAEALNALGRAKEAQAVADIARSQLHRTSWRREWFGVAIARSYFLQGKIAQGTDEACRAMRESDARGRKLVARDAAELILEFGTQILDSIVTSEARRTLDQVTAGQCVEDADIPNLGPLPGEAGWEKRVSEYFLRDVLPEWRGESPTQEQLDAAMVLAAEMGSSEAVLELLRTGASPRATDARRLSALAAAAKGGHEQTLEALLERTEPYDLENEQDVAAAVQAIGANQVGAIKVLLRAYGAKKSGPLNILLAYAATRGSGQAVEELCKAGADANALNGGLHPLVLAARFGNLDAVNTLSGRADINAAVDEGGETALMAATSAGHEAVAWWLRDHGAISR